MKNAPFFLLSLFFFTSLKGFAARQELHIPREDGSIIQGYLDLPDGEMSVPIVIFMNGSVPISVLPFQKSLAARFNPKNIGVISLEKRGISSEDVNEQELRSHDCLEAKLKDHKLLLKQIEELKIPRCNGPVILMGISEGGKIAPQLSLLFPSLIRGMVLIGSGGGFPFKEEVKYQIQRQIEGLSSFKRMLLPKEVKELDEHFAKMLENPDNLTIFCGQTWKWFASYLGYHPLSDLLIVKVPIYMIHGAQDLLIPVQSADLVKEAFEAKGKTNLHYARYDDLGHELAGREDVIIPMCDWIEKTF